MPWYLENWYIGKKNGMSNNKSVPSVSIYFVRRKALPCEIYCVWQNVMKIRDQIGITVRIMAVFIGLWGKLYYMNGGRRKASNICHSNYRSDFRDNETTVWIRHPCCRILSLLIPYVRATLFSGNFIFLYIRTCIVDRRSHSTDCWKFLRVDTRGPLGYISYTMDAGEGGIEAPPTMKFASLPEYSSLGTGRV